MARSTQPSHGWAAGTGATYRLSSKQDAKTRANFPKSKTRQNLRPHSLCCRPPIWAASERPLLFDDAARFDLARRLRSPAGAPLGEVFSFVSGLYFRGKAAYAGAFGRAPRELRAGLVISAGEGLRFLAEPVTIDRLRRWAAVPIDADNRRFTDPLVHHAAALERAYGTTARFVLLGSIASDKYARPLVRVFGDHLLFPSDFVGRGDMSRGALLLRAARSGRELGYEPIETAVRHGPRAPRIAARPRIRAAGNAQELVVLVGLPAAGKTSLYRDRFAGTHVHVNRDRLRTSRRQTELIDLALATGKSIVVDNTNASVSERATLIATARHLGIRVVGYYFDLTVRTCIVRNANRQGRDRVPNAAIFAVAKRMVAPSRHEGFDELYVISSQATAVPRSRATASIRRPAGHHRST